MKRFLLFVTLFAISFVLIGQTITWTGAGDGTNWSDHNNWDLTTIPTATNDVVIPDGSTLTINVAALAKSIEVQGASMLTIAHNFTFTDASILSPNVTVNWVYGVLTGGGTMTNQGTIDFTSTNIKSIIGNTVLNNEGIINITSAGGLYITDGVVNNQTNGIIDIQWDGVAMAYSGGSIHNLNNYGTIKKSEGTGLSEIHVLLNNEGIISAESGMMDFRNPNTILNGGIYNVFSGSQLRWYSNVTCSGTLTGVLEGDLYWLSVVNIPTSTTFNFSGTKALNWASGSLIGGGTLTNQSTIDLTTTNIKSIFENTVLNNEGTINFTSAGGLNITDGVVNNQVSGVIDIQWDGIAMSYSEVQLIS